MRLVSWKRRCSSGQLTGKAAAAPHSSQAAASQAPEVAATEAPAPTDEGLSVDVIRGHSSVMSDSRSALTVLFRIDVPRSARAEARRPPLQLACVLDCSGSMAGSKMDFAKRGVMKLVKHLGPGDTLHFVAYASSARVLFRDGDLSPTGKEGLRAQIMDLRPEGNTNLHEGLCAAASLFPSEKAGPHSKACRRIFLLSDGLVNTGITNSKKILASVQFWAQRGIKTSTFGIGVGFDEPLMRSIASVSGGHYCYFSSALAIPGLISKAVHDMLSLFATEASMQVTACDHAHVSHLYGGMEDEGDERHDEVTHMADAGAGKSATLHIGDLVYGDKRWLLISMKVLPKVAGPFQVLSWTLSARAPAGRSGSGPRVITSEGTVEVEAVTDAAELAAEHVSVRSAMSVQKVADLEQQVSRLLASKGRKSAQQLKEQQAALLTEALEDASSLCVPEAEMLARALSRVQVMKERFRGGASAEDLRRQAVEEHDKDRSMSITAWQAGEDSSVSLNGQSRDPSPDSRDSCDSPDISGLLAHEIRTPRGKAQGSQQGRAEPPLPEQKAPRGNSALGIPDVAPAPPKDSAAATAGSAKPESDRILVSL